VPGAHAEGQFCRTEFQVLKRFDNGTSLLAVNPITGRTNQIRIHLWELGFSIQGDQRFLPDREGGPVQTHAISDPPLCLHAQEIVFTHPVTGRRVSFSASIPDWAE
jgi:23S rRNA-/tRNA-specific pseudouridylate synthase